MLSPHIYAALVQERHQAFLAQAETDRRKRRARLRRPRRGAGAAATGNVRADADGSPVPQDAQHALAVPMSEAVYAILQPWAVRNQGEAQS